VDIIDILHKLCTTPSFGVFHNIPITHKTIVSKENTNVANPKILIILSITFIYSIPILLIIIS
jgi:hypothetical protein